jgi:CO dehydrogenase maturation factor
MNNKRALVGKRILVCGKGGSGKSSLVTLMTRELEAHDYKILVLDGDASNPVGITSLLFGYRHGPGPLLEFFGGREKVICPVDDPSPLTRRNDDIPIIENHLDLAEIPDEYVIKKENIYLFQAGKTKEVFEGCDGPMSKICRDFIVDGDHVTLIDVEAGIEHFGRGIEKNMDIVIIVVDPNYESILIAKAVKKYCDDLGIKYCAAIINKVETSEIENMLSGELKQLGLKILGVLHFDPHILQAALHRKPLNKGNSRQDMNLIIESLESYIDVEERVESA